MHRRLRKKTENMDEGLDLHGLFEHNSTFDYSDYEYKDDCNIRRSVLAIFVPILYSVALILGLIGNVLVLVVLWQKRRNWSITDAFVLHLSVADVLLLLTMPLLAVDAVKGWSFGSGLCKLTGVLFKINFYCSIFLLVCISLNLYISVVHTTQLFSHTRLCMVQLICLAVWIFCLLLTIPDWMYLNSASDSEHEDKTKCVYKYSTKESCLASRLLFHVLGFLLPVIVLLYSFIRVLPHCRPEMGIQKQRAVQVTFVLVLVFFITWTPYNIVLLVDTFRPSSRKPTEPCENQTWTAVKSTAVLGLLHSCLNPMIYLGFSEKFRHWTLTTMKCGSCAVDSGDYFLWDSRDIHSATSVPQEENGELQPVKNNTQQQNDQML
ncbi:C-X-C chemokine receptor type 3.3 isoform X2 [Tachysurus vachellii]|nr:C-X-C chemokine receptor type 3.3 isoform X2 [Tachysurus vachellii]